MAQLSVPMPVEMFRDANTYHGSGSTDIWYRWGYVMHPMGYNWLGNTTAFATSIDPDNDVTYAGQGRANANGDNIEGTSLGNSYVGTQVWGREYDPLNLGILPIFHS